MNRVKGTLITLVLLLMVRGTDAGGTSIVLPRAGQVGIGIQGQFGTLMKSGGLGAEFGSGAGLAVRLKYRMRYERGIGLSFETQSLDARTPGRGEGTFLGIHDPDTTLVRDRAVLNCAGFDLYQMFGTRTKSVKMLSAGIGIAQVSARLSDGETQYPLGGDGMYLSAGAGLEKFFYRSWAWDLGTRYQAIFLDGKVNHDVQASIGLIFYAAY